MLIVKTQHLHVQESNRHIAEILHHTTKSKTKNTEPIHLQYVTE